MKIQKEVQKVWRSLSRRRRQAIRAFAKGNSDARLRCRCQIVVSLVQGRRVTLIAEVLGCSTSEVYRVAHRFIEEGESGLGDRREDNGQPKVSEAYELRLIELVANQSPRNHRYRRPTWTQELLILVMEQHTGIRISRSTMSRLLKRLGIRLGCPKPVVGCPWKKARKRRRLRALKRLVEACPEEEVVVYVDEVDIHLNPKIGRDYMLRGTQKSVVTPGRNEKRYLAGALNARTGKLTWVEGHRKNSDLFILQLWELVQRDYPHAKCIHLILDNYRIHDSQRTQLALAALEGRVRLHFLPPYCPEHNPIERVWRDLHDNVTRNHQCRNMKELMREVRAYLRTRQRALRHQYAKRRAA